MNEAEVIEICREAIIVMLKVVGPVLLAGLVVGVVVSLFQAVTQIQESTLSFIPKMVVIFMITIWLLPFMMSPRMTQPIATIASQRFPFGSVASRLHARGVSNPPGT